MPVCGLYPNLGRGLTKVGSKAATALGLRGSAAEEEGTGAADLGLAARGWLEVRA